MPSAEAVRPPGKAMAKTHQIQVAAIRDANTPRQNGIVRSADRRTNQRYRRCRKCNY